MNWAPGLCRGFGLVGAVRNLFDDNRLVSSDSAVLLFKLKSRESDPQKVLDQITEQVGVVRITLLEHPAVRRKQMPVLNDAKGVNVWKSGSTSAFRGCQWMVLARIQQKKSRVPQPKVTTQYQSGIPVGIHDRSSSSKRLQTAWV